MAQSKCPITRGCQPALLAYDSLAPTLRLAYHPLVFCAVGMLCLVSYWFLDRSIAEYFHAHHAVFKNLAPYERFGLMPFYLVLFGLLSVGSCCTKRQTPPFFMIFVWLCTAYATCGVLKVLLGRARPTLWFQEHLFGFFGPHLHQIELFASFPSGHTTTLTAVALGLGLCFPKWIRAFLGIAFLCALTRVMLTFHYFSDVIGTTYLTIILFVTCFTGLRTFFSNGSTS